MSRYNKIRFRKTLLASAVTLSCINYVHAQEQQQTVTDTIEKISVISRGRVESIQNVPDSVTAFSAETIENSRITNFRDVANLTPNLSQLDNFRPGLARITIRGLITPQVGDPPLAFVVDGVTAPDLEFINQDLVDIERIEVMRGAQGALYGRGAIGGAVIVTTKKPIEDFEGKIKGSVGNGNTYNLNAVVSGSLNDENTAYFRAGGYIKDTDGLIKNTYTGDYADPLKEQSVFSQLEFELSEDTSINLKGKYTSSEAGFAYYQGVSDDTIEDFSINTSQNIINQDERDVYELSAKLTQHYDLGKFEFVTAYSNSENEHFYDGDYSADATFIDEDGFFRAPFGTEGLYDIESLTLESRFISQSDQIFRWSVSAFYQQRDRDTAVLFYDDFTDAEILTRADFANDEPYLSIIDNNSSDAWALAGQFNYDINEQLELTGAMRYDHDTRESFDPTNKDATYAKKSFSQLQPKVTLAYQMNDDLLLYTGYSRGFRSGGFNEPADGISRTFDKEISDSYEIGFKTALFNNKVTLNGAAFIIEQDDAQFTQFNIDTFTLENLSIDEVQTKGLELEAAFAATSNLSINLSAGIVDSEIKRFALRPELAGRPQFWVPEYNYGLSANHNLALNGEWSLFSRAELLIEGPKTFSIDIPDVESSRYTYLNAGVGLKSEQWSVQVYVDNLTDERAIEDIFLLADGVTDLVRQPNKPRSYGIELSYQF
ncbi:TonB-dependent receptor [Pseudoalteromonas sp. CST5]|uniref:TonB-dependent receptor n=1 Tax=unclassified Pseudoalteromonas TaxID=194690 RepID=UPI0023582BDB|nr:MULTISPECIES: TonB-dependent receptor [unclassified Pseudoalteromonas]MDC9512866.1 TonB-dependent receptor [Pseudoalteromonas sp. CST1]MDC9536745.1 TonB-dependent receptor [Pseudoalteromonas sp. CST3]MDC9539929.1 TonB-dependent receptor [Pseudoalteromonas sp. CST2]MDC9543672.1 TonB-dependent receptor [Pseudoalteromonas sp. CST4]MDC9547920.1 TonB-dependent receptor [Pseudoalteromonas sp. CST5]